MRSYNIYILASNKVNKYEFKLQKMFRLYLEWGNFKALDMYLLRLYNI